MAQPPDDPLIGFVVLSALLASVVTWAGLIARWRRGEPLLEHQPRTHVPWGAPIGLLAVVFVAITILTPAGDMAEKQPGGLHPTEASERLVGFILFQSAVIGGILMIVTVLYRATLRDLGLPVFAEELARDVRVGVVACLAAIAPVYGVQLLMLSIFGPSKHPLVEMVTSGEPNIGVVLLASIAAVLIAPVGEEILFRLLLQGWLEKLLNKRPIEPAAVLNDEVRTANDASPTPADSSFDIRHSSADDSLTPGASPQQPIAILRHGWLPILISSLLFGAAHSGYGPDPIAIFFLAIVLGYVYQQTHRILPCMIAHALFNSLAMFILWRIVWLNAE